MNSLNSLQIQSKYYRYALISSFIAFFASQAISTRDYVPSLTLSLPIGILLTITLVLSDFILRPHKVDPKLPVFFSNLIASFFLPNLPLSIFFAVIGVPFGLLGFGYL